MSMTEIFTIFVLPFLKWSILFELFPHSNVRSYMYMERGSASSELQESYVLV